MTWLLTVLVWITLLLTTVFVIGGVFAVIGILWREYHPWYNRRSEP